MDSKTLLEDALVKHGEDWILSMVVMSKDEPEAAATLLESVQEMDPSLFSSEALVAISQMATKYPPKNNCAVQTTFKVTHTIQ